MHGSGAGEDSPKILVPTFPQFISAKRDGWQREPARAPQRKPSHHGADHTGLGSWFLGQGEVSFG